MRSCGCGGGCSGGGSGDGGVSATVVAVEDDGDGGVDDCGCDMKAALSGDGGASGSSGSGGVDCCSYGMQAAIVDKAAGNTCHLNLQKRMSKEWT